MLMLREVQYLHGDVEEEGQYLHGDVKEQVQNLHGDVEEEGEQGLVVDRPADEATLIEL